MPEETPEKKAAGPKTESAWGISVQNLSPELAQKFGIDEKESGVIITDVAPESPGRRSQAARG